MRVLFLCHMINQWEFVKKGNWNRKSQIFLYGYFTPGSRSFGVSDSTVERRRLDPDMLDALLSGRRKWRCNLSNDLRFSRPSLKSTESIRYSARATRTRSRLYFDVAMRAYQWYNGDYIPTRGASCTSCRKAAPSCIPAREYARKSSLRVITLSKSFVCNITIRAMSYHIIIKQLCNQAQ